MTKKIFKKNSNMRRCLYTIIVLCFFLYHGQGVSALAQENPPPEDKTESSLMDPFSIKTQVPELFDLFMQRINEARRARETKLMQEAKKAIPPRVVKVKAPPPVKQKVVLPDMKITGVLYDGEHPVAVINGQVLQEGEIVAGAKIFKIEKKGIVFLFKEEKFTTSFNNE